MRKILRFFEMIIVGLLLTLFVITKLTSNIVLDKNTVKKQLEDAGIYEYMSKEIKKSIHNELDQVYNKYPEINVDLDEIIDNTLSDDILKEETNFILDSIYDYDENIALEPKIIIDGYRTNLDKYLKENNIELPKEVNDNIDKMLSTTEIEKIDLSEYTGEFRSYVNDYKNIINMIHIAIYILLISALLIMGFSVIVSKEKLKVVYRPLILSGILLLIIRIFGDKAFSMLKLESNEKLFIDFVGSAKKILFTNINIFIVLFLSIGIMLMVFRILFNKKK